MKLLHSIGSGEGGTFWMVLFGLIILVGYGIRKRRDAQRD